MTIGSNLKRLRAEAGLSQNALSKRAGVSQQLISQIEAEINTSTKNLPKLAKALGVPVADLDLRFGDETEGGKPHDVKNVPILTPDEILAGAFTATDDGYLAMSDLEPGDWIAMAMDDDAMDRVAPAGAYIIVNRAERELDDGGLFLFSAGPTVFCRRYKAGTTDRVDRLLPFSINPEHIAETFDRRIHTVLGRCRRSVLEF